MNVWGRPSKGRSSEIDACRYELSPGGDNLAQAEETAQRTRELLSTRGWCLWKCSTLGGEVIAVVLDEDVEGVPERYPVYTEAELEKLCQDDVSDSTLRLVHEAKKLAGAKVVAINKSEEVSDGKSVLSQMRAGNN